MSSAGEAPRNETFVCIGYRQKSLSSVLMQGAEKKQPVQLPSCRILYNVASLF